MILFILNKLIDKKYFISFEKMKDYYNAYNLIKKVKTKEDFSSFVDDLKENIETVEELIWNDDVDVDQLYSEYTQLNSSKLSFNDCQKQ